MNLSRRLLLVLLVVAGSAIVRAVWNLFPPVFPAPEIGLVVVLWSTLLGRERLTHDLLFALLVGYLSDLQSGTPTGLYMFGFALASLLLHLGAGKLLLERTWQTMALTWLVTLLHQLLLFGLAAPLLGDERLPWHRAPLVALVSSAASPLCLVLLRALVPAKSVAVHSSFVRHA